MKSATIFMFNHQNRDRTLYITDSIRHIRDSLLQDIYPNEIYDNFLGLDENNSEIHRIWKSIFINSTLEENINWFINKEFNIIFVNKGLQFTQDVTFLNSIANTIFTDYECF